jgi:hypothetical protein
MKMTRSKLKGIVKECLVEILAEGIDAKIHTQNSVKNQKKKQVQKERALQERKDRLETSIDKTVTSFTDDSIMQSILADTARTTLQEQLSHEGSRPSSPGSSGPGVNLDAIFSESESNWTKLAFTNK